MSPVPIGTAECSCRGARCRTNGEQQGCSPSRWITAARGMQNKGKPNEASRKHTVEKEVRSASRDSRSYPGLNRQTGVLIFPSHEDFFVTALRKQIRLHPAGEQQRNKSCLQNSFPSPRKGAMLQRHETTQLFVSSKSKGEAAAGRDGPRKPQASCPRAAGNS